MSQTDLSALGIIDASAKPPSAASRHLRSYAMGGGLQARIKRGLPPDKAILSQNLDDFVALQRGLGVTRTLVHAAASGPGYDPSASHETLSNAAVSEIVAAHPGALSGLASVDPIANPKAADELDRCFTPGGFIGLTIAPGYMPEPARCDDPRLDSIYEACIAHDRPVVILTGGFAGPDLGYSDPVNLDRLAGRMPKLRIVAAHSTYPYVEAGLCIVYRRPNVWLMPDMYFPAMPGEQSMLMGLRGFAAERILYSTCYPMCEPTTRLAQIAALQLPFPVLRRYLRENAAEVFRLGSN